MMDGKLLLLINGEGMSAQNVLQCYRLLADIERGFRVLKSEIEIGPPSSTVKIASACFC